MISRYSSKLMHLATIVAMVVQLGVVAFHHHEVLGAHGASGAHEVHAALSVTDYAGLDRHHDDDDHHNHEDHDAHGDQHHGPDDSDDHLCDLCLFKTALSKTLVPQASVAVIGTRTPTKLIYVLQDTRGHGERTDLYQARAPPLQAVHS